MRDRKMDNRTMDFFLPNSSSPHEVSTHFIHITQKTQTSLDIERTFCLIHKDNFQNAYADLESE